jgi:hypothetical protein
MANAHTTPVFQAISKLGNINMSRMSWHMGGEQRCCLAGKKYMICDTKYDLNNRFSASNASRLYDYTLTDHIYFHSSEWGFSNRLTTNHVWDVFIILSLLEDSLSSSRHLKVPHTGAQTNRFNVAMEERNARIILNGQPDAVQHACDRCMRIFSMPDGTFREF